MSSTVGEMIKGASKAGWTGVLTGEDLEFLEVQTGERENRAFERACSALRSGFITTRFVIN